MKRVILVLLAVLLLLCGCRAKPSVATRELFAMDTVMHLSVYGEEQDLLTQAQDTIVRLENLLSVTKETSDIARINQGEGEWVTVSEETANLLVAAKEYAQTTNGKFDPTVYPAVTAWGFTAEQTRVPATPQLQEFIPLIDYQKIEIEGNRVRLPKGMGIDLGGIAKGYAADEVKKLYRSAGGSGVISLGGNVLTVGQKPDGKPFTVAIQDPFTGNGQLAVLSVSGGTAAVTSGSYQRYFTQDGVTYHHIVDPVTAAPAQSDLVSVTVVTTSAAKADAYATALFVMGQQEALAQISSLGVEAVLVTADRQVYYTAGLTVTNQNNSYLFQRVGE